MRPTEMGTIEERPAKRVKTKASRRDETPHSHDLNQENVVTGRKSTAASLIKPKTRKFGNAGILDTIEKAPSNKKKAMSIAELKSIRDQGKSSDSSKKFTGIIEIKEDSELSMNSESSPFKLIRSSQEFNIDSPVANKTTEKVVSVTTPTIFRTRPSSDDGIFWITTPRSKQDASLGRYHTDTNVIGDSVTSAAASGPKLPSSPLKVDKDSQLKDLPDTLLDPELKTLIAKYGGSPARLKNKPLFSRCNSDSQTMAGNRHDGKRQSLTTQIVATKNSLNDSVVDSIARESRKESIRSSITHNDEKVDLSDMLVQIGSKLLTSLPAPVRENSSLTASSVFGNALKSNRLESRGGGENEVETPRADDKESIKISDDTEKDTVKEEDDRSDAFSDDIDMSELLVNATQAIPATARSGGDSDSSSGSDDSFSDDDDDLMEKIELGLTQPQVRGRRPNTDQTDITDVIEMEITQKTNSIELADSNKTGTSTTSTVSKYKGMMTRDEEDLRNGKNSKPFQLFDENENMAKTALKFKTMKRLQIKAVHEGIYKNNNNAKKQYVLKCLTDDDKLVNVMVRDHWSSLEFKVNDVIHIILSKPEDNFQLVDKDHNLLIWHPDTLLSSTRIADAVDCKRKSIINQKFNGPGIVSIPFIVGNITHALFQKCLLHKCVDPDFAEKIIEEQLDLHKIEIYAASKNREDMKNMILEHFSYIKEWITDYMTLTPGSNKQYQKTEYKATTILDIEESIVSPIFGIKGIIDVVIEAKLKDGGKYVIPLEIKTGREYLSNRAQVSLYTLLIKQRYDVNCFYTSLVYTKLHHCYLNAIKHNDFKLLVNIRNELAQYLVYAVTELPPILQRSSCERCFNVEPCMVLNKLTENGTAEESGLEVEMYNNITSHLNKPLYKEYYEHWDKLLTKEEGLMNFAKTDLWRSTAEYREANGGNSVGHLKVVNCDFSAVKDQFVYMFERDTSVYPPLTSSQLAKNDRIILSDENSMFGLAYGQIKLLRPDIIVIITERNWSNSAVKLADFNAENNQTFRSVLRTNSELTENSTSQYSQRLSSFITSKTFRIDKDQMFHGMAMARFNLLNLFLPDGDSRSRELIVELRKPKLSATPDFHYDVASLNLNQDQIRAVDVASKIDDYCLILGMPGTGKTTVISSIVDSIVKSGLTVLISSYTHSAVDNICEKLIKSAENRKEKLPLLRVGSPIRISPIVKPYSLYNEEFDNSIGDKSEFQDIVNDCQIVAATCLGLNDVVFGTGKRFDYCIIDEASQVTLPVVLGPIAFSDKFILVGDHYQLPPLVLHPEAKQEGLDRSLFKILSDAHPSSVIELTHQYRMCSDIMSLSNELIYDGRLKCGSEEVANKMLKIPYLDSLPLDGTCIKDILDPERRVIFVNEDAIPSLHEVSVGDKIENPGEAKIITTLIKVMLMGGIEQENVGVMSFYKAQLRHFFVSLAKYKNIEILTADRFQGRDKDVIIISLVRSEIIGDLLKEWRRVNVAMTRAKCKLIIFGSKKLLKSAEQFEGFMEMIDSNGWCYDLREGDERAAENLDFLEHNVSANLGSNQTNENENSTDNVNGISFSMNVSGGGAADTNGNFKGVKRLDKESRLIRRTTILKYVIDDLTK